MSFIYSVFLDGERCVFFFFHAVYCCCVMLFWGGSIILSPEMCTTCSVSNKKKYTF